MKKMIRCCEESGRNEGGGQRLRRWSTRLGAAGLALACWAGIPGEVRGEEGPTVPCPVAVEMAAKAMELFDLKPVPGLAGLEKAYALCPENVALGYNLGLARYLSGDRQRARQIWEKVHKGAPDHEKTLANLAWVTFELGRDEEAHLLAFRGLEKFPGNLSLAHTKVYALFRLGRYLEAYDWLVRAKLAGERAAGWMADAGEYTVEEVWRRFRMGETGEALSSAVNLLVREYPEEQRFVEAKDRLAQAAVDPQAAIPYAQPLPHEVWARAGDVDDRSGMLDQHLEALPPLAEWRKRQDAFALIVGVDRYQRLRARHFAERDARSMHTLLTRRGPFPADVRHVRLRVDEEARGEVLRADLEWLMLQGRLNPNAMLLFYFAGLGNPVGEKGRARELQLLPVDARSEWGETGEREGDGRETAGEGIDLSWLRAGLEALPNREVVVILDACFNGSEVCALQLKGSTLSVGKSLLHSRHPWLVAPLEGGERYHAPGRQGGLTYFLLKGLLGAGDGMVGGKRDGWVTITEASAAATQAMLRAKLGEPLLSQRSGTRLALAEGEK
ncbi:MAG: caspase family protein [Magnetococcales bacterium]|nr:caspase family protein [Magnetococcales bacterium]